MYLVYLDESGTPLKQDPDPYFSLGGIVVCERNWKSIDNDVEYIKRKYNLTELHMRKLYNKNKKVMNNEKSRPAKIINEVYDVISRSPLTLFCMSIDKPKEFRRTNDKADIENLAWDLLLNRLNISIDKMCRQYSTEEFALLIMDETNQRDDLRIRDYVKELRESGTTYQNLNRLIEDPVFTPSHWRNLVQLADAVVCCSKFYIRGEDFFTMQFEKIKDKFSKGANGSIINAGFKVW